MDSSASSVGPDISIKTERLPKKRLRANVSIVGATRGNAEKNALQKLAQNVNVKGFRPGKAPEHVVREQVSPEALLDQTIREVIPQILKDVYEKEKIDPVILPKIDVVSTEPLTFTITFVEEPDVKVKESGLKIEKKAHKVEAKDVDRVITQLLKEHTVETLVERAAKDGDVVIADFYGQDKDKKDIEGTKLNNYRIHIGSKTLIPGFEAGVEGMKAGETRELNLTFPEKYHAENLAGQPVTFHVTAKEVKEVKMPELTAEFLKEKLGTEKSPDELKKEVEASLISQEERLERERREQEFFEAVRRATKIELAEELVESEMQAMIRDLQQQMEQQQMTLDEWLKQVKKTWADVEKDIRENAEKRLTTRYGVKALIKQKEIVISDDEVKTRIEEELTYMPREEAEHMRSHMHPGEPQYEQVKWELEIKKLLDLFL